MLRRLWLIFAQATTIGLAVLFIVSTLRPEWLTRSASVPRPVSVPEVAIRQVTGATESARTIALSSFSDAVLAAAPAVVNVYTAKEVRRREPTEDPLYR